MSFMSSMYDLSSTLVIICQCLTYCAMLDSSIPQVLHSMANILLQSILVGLSWGDSGPFITGKEGLDNQLAL